MTIYTRIAKSVAQAERAHAWDQIKSTLRNTTT